MKQNTPVWSKYEKLTTCYGFIYILYWHYISLTGQRWKDMRSTLSPAFTSSKMRNMFVLITECGQQLCDFLEECIKDKNMKVKGCKIERGKYRPTITFFHTAAVIQVWHAHTHMYTQNTHNILPLSPSTSSSHVILMALKRVVLHPAIWTTPLYSSYFSRLGCISFSAVPLNSSHWSMFSCIPLSTDRFHCSTILQDRLNPLYHSYTCDQPYS